jgi:hypothetical protein
MICFILEPLLDPATDQRAAPQGVAGAEEAFLDIEPPEMGAYVMGL